MVVKARAKYSKEMSAIANCYRVSDSTSAR
jgi:hypothetical protein